MVRFQETLRRLAIIDESFVEDEVGLRLDLPGTPALDSMTVALLRVGLEWSAARALAAGASADQIADVLLAIAPVAGLGRVAAAVPGLATALGYDIEAALEESDDY
jgi:4-carboxymuconolactone decarboxylase